MDTLKAPLMLQCYNRGCGQLFDPENNGDDSCCHHPGIPFFHDVYKGWSCCSKKTVDFTEFLNIKGCTMSKHCNEKPAEPMKFPKDEYAASGKQEEKELRSPINLVAKRPSIDTPMVKIEATVAQALKDAIDTPKSKFSAKDKQNIAGEVTVGTCCKNSGCLYSFTGTPTDSNDCQYHPGEPIFHEGMKYWSCCQKKTTDFTAFMAQKGCAIGQHKWFKENESKHLVNCRFDWHQTATNIIVSIYAKKYHYAHSTVQVNPIRLHVRLVFPDQENAKFDLDLELRGVIDVNKTSVHMYSSKVEIIMPKAEPASWQKLDFPRDKLPAPLKSNNAVLNQITQRQDADLDDDFNLDDIETISTSVRLAEINTKK